MRIAPATGRPPARAAVGGLRDIADRYDVVLCDLWGVMHDGRRAFAPAVDAVTRFRWAGGTVVFITNAPRPHPPVVDQITGLGIPPTAYDDIVTSGDVTIASIAEQGQRPLYHIGPPRDRALFDAVEHRTGRRPVLTELPDAEVVVVTGLFDDTTETPDHYAVRLAAMRRQDRLLICANPDVVVHVGDTLIYCAGALAQAYAAIGGRTIMAGKPHAPIYRAALALAAEQRGTAVDHARVLAIGDGLATDVAGAARQAIDILFITTGIHRDDFHPGPDAAANGAGYHAKLAALTSSHGGHAVASLVSSGRARDEVRMRPAVVSPTTAGRRRPMSRS